MGKYNDLKLGRIEAIVNKLGGFEGIENFLSGKTVVRFKIWKTIKLGGSEKGTFYRTNDWANEIMASPDFKVSATEEYVNLAKVTPYDLGCTNQFSTRREVYKQALALGLKLCPSEIGLALRNQYTDQPKSEWLNIGMKAIDSNPQIGLESAFSLYHHHVSDELELLGDGCGDDDTFNLKTSNFIFCIRN